MLKQIAIVKVQKIKELAKIMLIPRIIWNNSFIDYGDAYLSIPFLIVPLLNGYRFGWF